MNQIYTHNMKILGALSTMLNTAEIVKTLLPHGVRRGNEWVSLNPTRPDKTTGSFSVNIVTGKWADFATDERGYNVISLYAYLKGTNYRNAAKELCGATLDVIADTIDWPCHEPLAETQQLRQQRRNEYIEKILRNAKPATFDTPVFRYLQSRGITKQLPYSIQYAELAHPSDKGSIYDVMLGVVTNWSSDHAIALHRTYLDRHGNKAAVDPNKMMLGSINGAGVWLGQKRDKYDSIVICEGIETGLSIRQILESDNTIVVAILSATNMKNILLPPVDAVKKVVIAPDNDDAGLNAMQNLGQQLQALSYNVVSAVPPIEGQDFNDVLIA